MKNQFLTNEIHTTTLQARDLYLDILFKKQQFGGTPSKELKSSHQTHLDNLNTFRDKAVKAAGDGDVPNAIWLLIGLVKEWAAYRAVLDLLNAKGAYLDAFDPETGKAFFQALQHKIVLWTGELQNKWHEGEVRRKTDLGNLQWKHQAEVSGAYQGVIQTQGTALNQAHQANKQYADTALNGVQQAQQSAQWMMQGVTQMNQQMSQNVNWFQQGVQGMYTHGVNAMNAAIQTQQQFTKSVEQNLPREVEKAQVRAERRKLFTRAGCALVILLAIPTVLAVAYFLLTQVVLPH